MDWPGLMRAGLFELRLTPEVFWKLTPIELRIMLGADKSAPVLTRARLEELAALFPDGEPNGGSDRTDGPDRGA
ncbi:rcc01693 family protein [Stagnihabitans tardus]|uniref:Phage tail assembly chaperone n=1 Tax=Stagnihabitans tardus TaxID=2699202 RepID=A0AAE5BSZ3_9RHOB|nr:rcc01693 family protein [Stagnihabitans tardus]NBZ86031.1 phage tail assembly chaperone [Stagnihabitans tardus]